MGCIFCRIAAGEVPAQVAFRDEAVTVFHDAGPQAPTHLLVVPNRHIGSLAELDDPALAGALLSACAAAARQAGLVGGYRVVTNVGVDGGQSVGHLHFHVLGGRAMRWPPG
jgi:histidine triad (HIT) family protein